MCRAFPRAVPTSGWCGGWSVSGARSCLPGCRRGLHQPPCGRHSEDHVCAGRFREPCLLLAGVGDGRSRVRDPACRDVAEDYTSRLAADILKTTYVPGVSESRAYFWLVWGMVGLGCAILLAGMSQPITPAALRPTF